MTWGSDSWGSDTGQPPDIRRAHATARILLICPDCGHENAEYAQMLRGKNIFYCAGDGCDYIFDLGRRQDFGASFADLWKRFYAALYVASRAG